MELVIKALESRLRELLILINKYSTMTDTEYEMFNIDETETRIDYVRKLMDEHIETEKAIGILKAL